LRSDWKRPITTHDDDHSQTRRGGAVLHHVTMAYDIDTPKMLEVLRIGREKLSDKATQSAAKRVDPLRSQTGLPRAEIIDRMIETFRAAHGLVDDRLLPPELEHAEALAAAKFASAAWTGIVP
jgi:lipoate-protein ligase A